MHIGLSGFLAKKPDLNRTGTDRFGPGVFFLFLFWFGCFFWRKIEPNRKCSPLYAITNISYKTFFFILGSFSNYLPKTSLEHPFFLSMPTSLIIYHFGVSLSSTNVSNETWPHILQIHNSITFLCIP